MSKPRKDFNGGEISRRNFLGSLTAGAVVSASWSATKPPFQPDNRIDRKALVMRHHPALYRFDPSSPLSVGNGEFAFTADITGLQTFPELYERTMPLCTMAQWGWHSTPLPSGLEPAKFRFTPYDTFGRSVGYATSSEGQRELYDWLRQNPHRLHLGRIGLVVLKGSEAAAPADLSDIKQELDLWSGLLRSRYKFAGEEISVTTAVHPRYDLLAVEIKSGMVRQGRPARLGVRFGFPFGSPAMNAADWKKTKSHITNVVERSRHSIRLHRQLDHDEYEVRVEWTGEATFDHDEPHQFILYPAGSSDTLAFTVSFSARPIRGRLPNAAATLTAAAEHWRKFWSTGAAVDFSGSRTEYALELERRIVLSQYLTAIQCAGSMPPQETGLTVNSWYGKFHLEMHWWHAAHFALWNRLPLLEKSLAWYQQILPSARRRAQSQGYGGARWPKMVGPEGKDSPSPIGPLLIWQQPHPIFYAELCYQSRRNRRTLELYRQIVFESAEFMASFAHFDQIQKRYVLGPPVIPAQENHPPRETWNPTFELAYWRYGLQTAQRWRERLGLGRNSQWDRVLAGLSRLPIDNGVYLAHENCPQTYTERNYDHPSMLAAFGVLPGEGVDRETMRRTLQKVWREWQWDKTWGWDYPMVAMCAARLGEPKLALEALLMETEKNRYLLNGHNWQRDNLPCYLPGNGGLLYAIALMAAGWQGSPNDATPGFPKDGSWRVRAEGFNKELFRGI